jgi:hypothetical protein
MAEPASSSPPPPPVTRPASPWVLVCSGLAAGLLLASIFLVLRRWLRPEPEPPAEGYFAVAAETSEEGLVEELGGTSSERAQTFARLRDQVRAAERRGEGSDPELLFERDVLPSYGEAERFTQWLLGFRRSPGSAGGVAAKQAAEEERRDRE